MQSRLVRAGSALALTALLIGSVMAANAVRVAVNGQYLQGQTAVERAGTYFVPIRPVANKVGATVEFNRDAQRVVICRKDHTCTSIKIGDGPDAAAIINGTAHAGYEVLAKRLNGAAAYFPEQNVVSFRVN